ncbi:MAG: hypothetical protein NTZ82_04435 [Bacteroidetes bacterium]|nr:hypothetical protein [Bacteroidota bacterium]
MVKKILFGIFLTLITIASYAQSALLDDIKLMNAERNKQLLHKYVNENDEDDSSYLHSFMIRSTQAYQSLSNTSLFKYKNFSIKSFQLTYNSQNNNFLPYGSNDGNMYPARGKQERFSAGANIRWGILDINIQPEWVRLENIEQELFKGNENDRNWWTRYYKIVANNIDDFRQFGKLPINSVSLGQSRIGLSTKKWSIGISNENIWWGPGQRNSIIYTNNAPGFIHAYLQTNKPIITGIGNFEFKMISGKIDSLNWINPDQRMMCAIWPGAIIPKINEQRVMHAFTINYSPKWFPNLYLGYAYSTQHYSRDTDQLIEPFTMAKTNNDKYSIGTMMMRLKLPKEHAEIYAELGQPRSMGLPWDFFKDSAINGFVFGIKKLFISPNNKSYFEFNFEATQLQLMDAKEIFVGGDPFGTPKNNSFYTSPIIRQGYTNEAQLLGASIGPGSASQTISVSWNKGLNKIGLIVERVNHNTDFYHVAYLSALGNSMADAYYVDLTTGVEAQWNPQKNILIGASYINSKALNYRWVKRIVDDKYVFGDPGVGSDKSNTQITLSLKFLFNGRN